jgi:Na+/pantothenate symporter
MFLILISIPKLAGLIVYRGVIVNVYQDIGFSTNATADEIQAWITVIGTILIGIWLVLGGTGIFNFFNKIWKYIKNTE